MKVTANEFEALRGIDNSEYGYELTDAVWSWSVTTNCNLAPASIPGVIASLSTKGLVRCNGEGKDREVRMTIEGARMYRFQCADKGQSVRKPLTID